MFKPLKRIVINNDTQMAVLLEDAGVYPSVPFTGWSSDTEKVRLLNFSDAFSAGNIVAVRRTVQTGSTAVLSAGNYSTPTVVAPVAPINPDATLVTQNVRLASSQTATLLVNAVPPVGSICRIKTLYRAIDRSRVEFNYGSKPLLTNFKITADITTTALLAEKIKLLLEEEYSKNGDTKNVTVVRAGSTLTITGFEVGIEFTLYVGQTEHLDYTPIDATFTVTIPAFQGALDYYNMRAYVQSTSGYYNIQTGETDFLPVKGALYDAYFIKYRVKDVEGLYNEHQSGTINAEQSHIVDLEIYVKQGSDTQTLRTALDAIAGF